jgi:ERCC4-type nuclease
MKIIIDRREMRSKVPESLQKLGAEIEIATLEVGDYIVSDRVAFERKTVNDLFSTLLERIELFSQLNNLARSYRRSHSYSRGEDPFFFSGLRISPKAIQGFLNNFALMHIPTLYTLNEAETAQAIGMIAKKEQAEKNRQVNLHGKRRRLSQSEAKEYIVSSIQGIGPVVARNFLGHFGSVEKVMAAPWEELMRVEFVGCKIADHIRELAEGRYDSK